MAEEGRGSAGAGSGDGPTNLFARSIEDFVTQMRTFTESVQRMATGSVPKGFTLPTLPSPPGAMSAAQLKAVAQALTAQRQQLAAMTAQFQAFDQQLEIFEKVLEPLVEWSSTWARLEEGVSSLVRAQPAAGRSAAPSSGEA
jgi:hypothetical protein